MRRAVSSSSLILLTAGAALAAAGCGSPAPPAPRPYVDPYAVDHNSIKFKDEAPANAEPAGDFATLQLETETGAAVPLAERIGERNLVLVFLRGWNGAICPYCSTQTSRLIANAADFDKRNARIVVVYPLRSRDDVTRLQGFVVSTRQKLESAPKDLPVEFLLDVELQAVEQLGIGGDLAKPSTYILDPAGQVRYAYVGASLADRPSVKALLAQLDAINAEAAAP